MKVEIVMVFGKTESQYGTYDFNTDAEKKQGK